MAYELFCDSMDTDVSTGRWTVYTGDYPYISVPSSSNGRHGSASMRIGASVPNGGSGYRCDYFTASTHVVAGCAVLKTSADTFSAITIRSGSSDGVGVWLDTDGLIKYRIPSGTITSSGVSISASAWYYIELGVVIGSSGTITIKLNGTTIVDVSGVDTRPGGSSTANHVGYYSYRGASATYTDYDDLYIAYGDELKWLGDIRVDALALSGDSTPQDWTPDTGNAWERLNAAAGNISSGTVDAESLFDVADFTAATTAIHGVQISAIARKTDAGSRSLALETKSGSTTVTSSDIALGDTSLTYSNTFVNDPDTSSAWTDGGVDALKVGVKVAA